MTGWINFTFLESTAAYIISIQPLNVAYGRKHTLLESLSKYNTEQKKGGRMKDGRLVTTALLLFHLMQKTIFKSFICKALMLMSSVWSLDIYYLCILPFKNVRKALWIKPSSPSGLAAGAPGKSHSRGQCWQLTPTVIPLAMVIRDLVSLDMEFHHAY